MSDSARPLHEFLGDALSGLAREQLGGPAASVLVRGVACDTRTLGPGELFVVVQGTKDDGARYATEAVRRGACALVVPDDAPRALEELGVPVVRVEDPRGALASLAAAYHGHPARAMRVVGVTGTNGKTTTTHLVRAVLENADRGPCALIGTIRYEWPGETIVAKNTTPGAAELQALLARARDAGCRSVSMEVSSHALDQRRVEGIPFAGAVFTNLTGDHLDYHGSMDRYAEAKARLFQSLGLRAVAAVNAEDGFSPAMIRNSRAHVITFGLDAPAHAAVTARDLRMSADGVRFVLQVPGGEAEVASPLVGRYNVMNLLAAAAVTHGLGVPADAIARGLGALRGVRGRLEAVEAGQPFTILVDYAHSDDAVANVLRNLRNVVPRTQLVVLGCGGDRDRTKRPRMARAAAELAGLCWFTSDNPRSEEPARIVDDMLAGVYGARNVRVELDRRRAIAAAVREAHVGDCGAILGKGHEDYQIFADRTVRFDDREAAADAVRALLEAEERALRTR